MLNSSLIDRARDTDPLALAEQYTTLRRKDSKEYCGPCPVCKQGKDCFSVQPEARRWLCRKCTEGKWRDVIALYRGITGATFAEAVTALTGALPPAPTTRRVEPEPKHEGPPDSLWQAKAQALIAEAEAALWRADNARAVCWLNARGLADETLRHWHVGLIDRDRRERPEAWGLESQRPNDSIWIPRGILIPCIVNGAIWYVKIRRPVGEPKYIQIRGGGPALFMADTLPPAREACITEGEFDSMLLWQCLQHATNPRWRSLGVATLGSKSTRLDLDHWARYLYHIRHLVIMYDQDGESEEAKRYWQEIAGRAFVLRWQNIREGDKDLTDFHNSGGRLLDLASWGVMQAEYYDPDPLPGYVSDFIADAGLTVTDFYHEGDTWHAAISKPSEVTESQGIK